MTELQFRKKIREARKLLSLKSNYNRGITNEHGVCTALDRAFGNAFLYRYDDNESVASLFGETFVPFRNRKDYWLGALNEENEDYRRLFLNLFEEYMVVNQYYLAY